MSGVVLFCISRYTNIDLQLSDWMYDSARQEFPWRDNWFSSVFMHRWAKHAFIAIGAAIWGMLVVNATFRPDWLSRVTRGKLLVVGLSYLFVPLVVALLKSRSVYHCPWDMERYGGFAPYLRLFDQLPAGFSSGHCFPAGHAASALWLAAFAVFWLPRRPKAAAFVFALGLVPGLILGWVQQMRGAHFLTHTLWSAWVASLVIVLIARYVQRSQ